MGSGSARSDTGLRFAIDMGTECGRTSAIVSQSSATPVSSMSCHLISRIQLGIVRLHFVRSTQGRTAMNSSRLWRGTCV